MILCKDWSHKKLRQSPVFFANPAPIQPDQCTRYRSIQILQKTKIWASSKVRQIFDNNYFWKIQPCEHASYLRPEPPKALIFGGGKRWNLPGVAVLVDLAEPGPLAELLVVRHFHERDGVLRA